MATLEDLFAQYNQQLNQAQAERLQAFRDILNGTQGFGTNVNENKNRNNAKKFASLADMNAALAAQRAAAAKPRPAPPVINKDARLKQVEHELDIIRGVVPTPRGYKIDKSHVKELLSERNELLR
jgi:hypothetical protein